MVYVRLHLEKWQRRQHAVLFFQGVLGFYAGPIGGTGIEREGDADSGADGNQALFWQHVVIKFNGKVMGVRMLQQLGAPYLTGTMRRADRLSAVYRTGAGGNRSAVAVQGVCGTMPKPWQSWFAGS